MTTLATIQEHLRHLVETTEMDADRRPELTYHLDRQDWATLVRVALAMENPSSAPPVEGEDPFAMCADTPVPGLPARLMDAIVERSLSIPEAQETREFLILESALVGVVFGDDERDRIVEQLLCRDWPIPQKATDKLVLNIMFNAKVRWDLIQGLLDRKDFPSGKTLHEVAVTLDGVNRGYQADQLRAMVEAAQLQEQLGRERPSHARRPDGSDTAMGAGL